MSDCALSLHPLNSSSLSSVSTSCPISSPSLCCSSSSMWSELPSDKSPVHPQNEEYGAVAIRDPLTGYDPKQLDNFDYSETYTGIFRRPFPAKSTRRSWPSRARTAVKRSRGSKLEQSGAFKNVTGVLARTDYSWCQDERRDSANQEHSPR